MCENGRLNPMISWKGKYIPGNVFNHRKETFIKDWQSESVLGLYLSEDIPNFADHDVSESHMVPWLATTVTFLPLLISRYYGTMEYLMPRWTAQSRKGGRTGKGTEWGTVREVQRGQKWTGNGKRGGKREQGGQRGSEEGRRPLVGNTSEYQESYGGSSAN